MKKLFLTSAILATIICPTFADNITTTNNDCDNTTLTTYSGSAVLEADWSANTVNVTYYNGDNVYGNAGSCTYDDTLTLPNAPSKTGYIFNGWTVKTAAAPQCSLSGIDTSIDGTDSGYILSDGSGRYNASKYKLSNNGEWATEFFSYGIIKGIALCSSTYSDTSYATGTPDETGGGQYCWCKVTGYDEDKDGEYCPIAASLWAFNGDFEFAASCASNCSIYCGNSAQNDADFRVGLFGSSN